MSQKIFDSKPLSYLCEVEKIWQHIERLLAQHDYVVVPNLGGFVVQKQSAQFLSDRIAPPLETIGFNPLMLHADGLLAIEVSRSEQISYRKAVEYIDFEVENIKNRLNINGNVIIGNLGVMHQNTDGTLLFSPIYKASFLPQNFGLSDLYVSTREKNSFEEQKKITFTLPSSRIFKYVAAAMIIFGLFFIAPPITDLRQADYANIASVTFNKVLKDTIPTKTTVESTTIQNSDTVASVAKLTNKFHTEISNKFHVIVASLPTEKSAEKFCKELVSQNFPNAHLISPSRIHRVAIQSFSKRNEAIQYMEQLRQTDRRFESAWVFCN